MTGSLPALTLAAAACLAQGGPGEEPWLRGEPRVAVGGDAVRAITAEDTAPSPTAARIRFELDRARLAATPEIRIEGFSIPLRSSASAASESPLVVSALRLECAAAAERQFAITLEDGSAGISAALRFGEESAASDGEAFATLEIRRVGGSFGVVQAADVLVCDAVNASDESVVVPVSLADHAAWSGATIRDLVAGDSLGTCAAGFLLPLPPRAIRRLELRPFPEPQVAGEVVLLAADGPLANAVATTFTANDPALAVAVDAAFAARREFVIVVHLPGAGGLDPLPPSIARHVLPWILPYRAVAKPIAPASAGARFTQRSSNLAYALGFPEQPPAARDWLVCLEAGFLATPLQPRLVDGMPAARGFGVWLDPGELYVTIGFSATERAAFSATLAQGTRRLEASRAISAAQQAVRLDQAPVGMFAGLSHLAKVRAEDLVPGDPIVVGRWAVVAPPDSRRRLRTLALPGTNANAARLTEDVLAFDGSIVFAIDVPQPFREPLTVVVRRPGATAPSLLTHNGLPLRRVAHTADVAGSWLEELYSLTPAEVAGQLRVELTLTTTEGPSEVARLGFFAGPKGAPPAVAYLTPAAIDPGPAAVGFGQRLDGRPVEHGGRVHVNAIELSSGSRVSFAPPGQGEVGILVGTVTAPEGEPEDGGGILVVKVDGVEAVRFDLRPNRPEPLPLQVEAKGARSIEFECLARGRSAGSVLVLDPRLR